MTINGIKTLMVFDDGCETKEKKKKAQVLLSSAFEKLTPTILSISHPWC